ncbi:MAG: hypothetical protein IRZ10_12450 [Thermoflavifilum sp.]|nr:hypothetical protein [Thermoflavifilum sp.]MCL6515210.1 hypothetical protein [Alicyclobacillus sp.]
MDAKSFVAGQEGSGTTFTVLLPAVKQSLLPTRAGWAPISTHMRTAETPPPKNGVPS